MAASAQATKSEPETPKGKGIKRNNGKCKAENGSRY